MPFTLSRQGERIQEKTSQQVGHSRDICTGGSTRNLHLPALDWAKHLHLRYWTNVTTLLGSTPLDSTNPREICVWNCVPSHYLLILEKQGLCSFVKNWTLPYSFICGRTFLSLASLHYGRKAVAIFMINIQSLSILYEAFLATHCSSDVLQSRRVSFWWRERERKKLWGSLFSPTWKDETALESLWHLKNCTVKRMFLAWKAGKRTEQSHACLISPALIKAWRPGGPSLYLMIYFLLMIHWTKLSQDADPRASLSENLHEVGQFWQLGIPHDSNMNWPGR